MIKYKYTQTLCKIIYSLADPEKVNEFSFDNELIRYSTEDYIIRILLHQRHGCDPCAIRFRDENWNQTPLVQLLEYEDSDYFNASLIVPIKLDIDSVRNIVDECKNIVKITNKPILIIIESNS